MATLTLTLPEAQVTSAMRRLMTTMEREGDRVVADVAVRVDDHIVTHWPVDTGVSRGAWSGPHQVAPLHYELRNPMIYASIIEYGSYVGVGPKTAEYGGTALPGDYTINPGIYVTQVPQAPVRRALSAHHNAITEGFQQLLRTTWGR